MKPNERSIDVKLDFRRAMFLLKNRIFTVKDLLEYWHFSGPCQEDHPDIEKI